MTFQQATHKISTLTDNIEKVIFGKREAILQVIAAFICNEHILIEDRPGVGKSRLIAALAKSIDASFSRIQFTPDILPSDITGVTIYNPGKQEFVFRSGPVFNQIIMADELNRTPPRTQSCLLEVMDEHQTTVDGITHRLPQPFMVLASQNPLDYEGTYPLPEAQLDRFLLCITLGYPDPEVERNIIKTYGTSDPLSDLKSVLTTDDILKMQGLVKKIEFNDELNGYIQTLLTKSREYPDVYLGISPRGGIALAKAARAWALICERDYVIPDDIKKMALPVFRHRLLTEQTFSDDPRTPVEIIESICEETPVPVL